MLKNALQLITNVVSVAFISKAFTTSSYTYQKCFLYPKAIGTHKVDSDTHKTIVLCIPDVRSTAYKFCCVK